MVGEEVGDMEHGIIAITIKNEVRFYRWIIGWDLISHPLHRWIGSFLIVRELSLSGDLPAATTITIVSFQTFQTPPPPYGHLGPLYAIGEQPPPPSLIFVALWLSHPPSHSSLGINLASQEQASEFLLVFLG